MNSDVLALGGWLMLCLALILNCNTSFLSGAFLLFVIGLSVDLKK